MNDYKNDTDILSRIIKSLSHTPIPDSVGPCLHYTTDDYEKYVELIMDDKRKEAFETHYPECLSCLKGLREAFGLDKKDEESLSEEELTGYLQGAQHTLDTLLPTEKRQESIYLLAASPKQHAKSYGTAYGVAVDEEARKGLLIECVAGAGIAEQKGGRLKINAEEILEVRKEGYEYRKSPPFDFIRAKLKELSNENEYLIPFRLDCHDISVTVEPVRERGFFQEAKSLDLAIIVAILSAVTGQAIDKSTVFSARVQLTGALGLPVGDVPLKLRTAKDAGVTKIILPEVNRRDCPEEFRCDEAFSVFFFSHIGQVLQYLKLAVDTSFAIDVPARTEAEKTGAEAGPVTVVPAWQPEKESEVEARVITLAREVGISSRTIDEIMEVAERLSQVRAELKPISTAIIIGHVEKTAGLLPPSEMKLSVPLGGGKMATLLRHLSSVVNGQTTAFLINTQGGLDSIRKTNIQLAGDFQLSPLLSEPNLRYATISAVTNSLIFLLLPGGNRIYLFFNGRMVCKYLNAKWRLVDLKKLETRLLNVARDKAYDPDTVERTAKIALRMAELNLGALFVIFDAALDITGKYDDRLESLGVGFTSRALDELKDDEVINFAKEDGATLIDSNGFFRHFRAYLKPSTSKTLKFDVGVGARHINAKRFSADASCLTVIVSEDGAVTFYCDGEKVDRI